jgi:shikimate kinase
MQSSIMKIFLIGMPGSGKTTLGKQLAEKFSLQFVDLDEEIQKEAAKSVQEIFSQQGEDAFRQLESSLLIRWASSSKSFVMATGGGAPVFFDGIGIINKTGLSVFLDVSVEEILRRLAALNDRPLLHSGDEQEKRMKLSALLQKRLPIYQKAVLTFNGTEINQLVSLIRTRTRTQR